MKKTLLTHVYKRDRLSSPCLKQLRHIASLKWQAGAGTLHCVRIRAEQIKVQTFTWKLHVLVLVLVHVGYDRALSFLALSGGSEDFSGRSWTVHGSYYTLC